MIRWYDYVAAVLLADVTLGFILLGFTSAIWWQPLLYGFLAGLTLRVWNAGYCQYRLQQEMRHGQ